MNNYDMIKYFFETGIYEVEDVLKSVEEKLITADEFHLITGYNYEGIKKQSK